MQRKANNSTGDSRATLRAVHTLTRARWPPGYALRHSTVASAVFDENLRCRAANPVFLTMFGVPALRCIGKTFPEILGTELPQFDAALLKAWKSKQALCEQRIRGVPPSAGEDRVWLVDFFPVRDGKRQKSMVAAAFSEVTHRGRIERKLSRLAKRLQSEKNGASSDVLGETPPPAECMELLRRTVHLLDRSMALRRAVSEIRLKESLRRQALQTGADELGSAIQALEALEALEASDHPPAPSSKNKAATANDVGRSSAQNQSSRPSPREVQVVRLLADGMSNKQIASALNLSIRTVETYRSRLMAKLKIHSAAEIVRYAIRNNLIQA